MRELEGVVEEGRVEGEGGGGVEGGEGEEGGVGVGWQ